MVFELLGPFAEYVFAVIGLAVGGVTLYLLGPVAANIVLYWGLDKAEADVLF